MKVVKRVLSSLLVLVLVITLSGCIRIVYESETEDVDNVVNVKKQEQEQSGEKAQGEEKVEEQEKIEVKVEKESKNEKESGENKIKAEEFSEVPDELMSFQFEIYGEVHQVPMTYSEIKAMGFETTSDVNVKIKPMSSGNPLTFRKGDVMAYVMPYNFDVNTEIAKDCYMGSFGFNDYYIKDFEGEIKLPKGIIINKSTYKDVLAVYGKPFEEKRTERYINIKYGEALEQRVYLDFDVKSEVLVNFRMVNYSRPDEFQISEVGKETPPIVEMYKVPTGINDNPFVYDVNYDGALYRIPAPVSEFEKNGWTIIEDQQNIEIVGLKHAGILKMYKGEDVIKVDVSNYHEDIVHISNCFVTSISSNSSVNNIAMEIFKGIKQGMSEDRLIEVIQGLDYEVSEGSLDTAYVIKDPVNRYDGMTIRVSKDSKKVARFKMVNKPKFGKLFER